MAAVVCKVEVEEWGACDDDSGAGVGGAGVEVVWEVPELPPDGCEVEVSAPVTEVVSKGTHAPDELLPIGEVAPAGHSVHRA